MLLYKEQIFNNYVKEIGYEKNVEIFQTALGSYDCPKSIVIYENPHNSGGSFVKNDFI